MAFQDISAVSFQTYSYEAAPLRRGLVGPEGAFSIQACENIISPAFSLQFHFTPEGFLSIKADLGSAAVKGFFYCFIVIIFYCTLYRSYFPAILGLILMYQSSYM